MVESGKLPKWWDAYILRGSIFAPKFCFSQQFPIVYNNPMNEELTSIRPTSLMRALSKGLRDAYDHMGYVVFTTFLSFLITSLLLSLAVLVQRKTSGQLWVVLVVLGSFAAWLCAVGVFYYVNKAVFHQHPVLTDTWRGIKTLFRPAALLFIVDFIITLVFVGDVAFFLVLMGSKGSVFIIIGVLCGYLTLMWLMMAMYHLPLLIAQLSMESGPKPLVILRKSYLIMMDNPTFTVGLFLAIIAIAVLCVLPMLIGMTILFLGVAAFLLTHALRELFIKYGIVEEETDIAQEEPWSLPESWRKRDNQDS